jgi:nicotinate-nucleotide adenylyltransferase
VWWLVSPGNPLKERGPAPLAKRMAACRALIDHPRIQITDFEAQAGTRYTAETLARLQDARPGVTFVWLMGADNLAQFDQWQDWREIMHRVPVGVLARPGQQISARVSKAARIYRESRLAARQSLYLSRCEPPAWCFVNVPMTAISSTAIRARGDWTGLEEN